MSVFVLGDGKKMRFPLSATLFLSTNRFLLVCFSEHDRFYFLHRFTSIDAIARKGENGFFGWRRATSQREKEKTKLIAAINLIGNSFDFLANLTGK